ncbi:MAG TPA: ECF transporter S component [Actinomycetales bacterium]|nr:ECF transporter S component [Actinomycetales bacterium]
MSEPVHGPVDRAASSATIDQTPPATRGWRVVDIVVASVLGVAAGVVFWAWGLAWGPLSGLLAVFAPLAGLLAGGWLFAGVLGGLVIRKPGAALFTEVVAGVVSMMVGTQWGFSVLLWAVLEGLGAELGFALLRYRRWGLSAALLSGGLAGVVVGILDTTFTSYVTWEITWRAVYFGCAVISGLMIAGLLSWVAVRALATTGALAPFASGRTAREV